MSHHRLPLPGCAPIPLAHYLKALGILRLVAEDAEHGDPAATGCWDRDVFILHSRLDRDGLLDFFLHHYQPTPILAPWNGGSGFYFREEKLKEKDPVTGKRLKTGKRNEPTKATHVVDALAAAGDHRLRPYQSAIALTRKILAAHNLRSAPGDAAKDDLLIELRNRWPDPAVQWLDCVVVLTSDSRRSRSQTGLLPDYTTLLGSGANDGNADFSSNFMQRVNEVLLNKENTESGRSLRWLQVSLFGDNHPGSHIKALAGQYTPGSAGGPNTVPGFKGEFSVNPWNFVFLIEGTLFFAAAAAKRHGAPGSSGMSYPFAVRAAGAGYASSSAKDELADQSSTEELWMPLWSHPTSKAELSAVLSEGRAQVRDTAAKTGVDFARAVCANGTDRGLDEFVRYGFLIRRGDSTSATPLGRFKVRRNARADLLSDVDPWLDRLRRAAGPSAKNVPSAVSRAVNHVESRILDLCKEGSPARVQAVLVALGQTECALSRSLAWSTGRNEKLPAQKCAPLAGLSARWLHEADDGSAEFRLAAALASVSGIYKDNDGGPVALPLRLHLEPVSLRVARDRHWFAWHDPPSNDLVWHEGDFLDVLNRVFARRLVRAEQTGHSELPDRAHCFAPLTDVVAFLEGRTDDDRLSDLLWGLCMLEWANEARSADSQSALSLASSRQAAATAAALWIENPQYSGQQVRAVSEIPSALFALLRLAFAHVDERGGWPAVPAVPMIHRHAAAGHGREASRLAVRRLRGSGLHPALNEVAVTGEAARRAAAALVFPLSRRDFTRLGELVLKPQTDN
ncbi:MAG: type I-U CRISPR-associated protein Csx17 [Verrucomicrobia bacterium]|nr:type I-U CRISPR-associated protein Csx17 [Verrucomicrobiota bacterium]